jgi:hypothetical protein
MAQELSDRDQQGVLILAITVTVEVMAHEGGLLSPIQFPDTV